MNADAFRHLYAYHFAANRQLWDAYVSELSDAQFIQDSDYSHGSVRDQLVHLMSVDDAWFGDLRAAAGPDSGIPTADGDDIDPSTLTDRQSLRAHWDAVERDMRAYLDTLADAKLFERPLSGEDAELTLWQILLHVANHGTDHRAQILRLLADLGVETGPQDYVFYAYGHPV